MLNTLKPFILALLVPGALVIILLLAGVVRPNEILQQVHPTECAWEMFTNKELPELTQEWRAKLDTAGIQATAASASVVVEPYVCGQETSSGYREVSRMDQASGPASLSATILVKDITDSETLGSLTQKIVEAAQSIPDYPFSIQDSYIVLTFMADQNHVKSLQFKVNTESQWRSQGLSGAALLNALEKGQ